jgi:hypothetical protein
MRAHHSVCFDQSELVPESERLSLLRKKATEKTAAPIFTDDDMIADWRERDAQWHRTC